MGQLHHTFSILNYLPSAEVLLGKKFLSLLCNNSLYLQPPVPSNAATQHLTIGLLIEILNQPLG